MKIIYGKKLDDSETKIVNDIASACGILFDTARLLFYRGIDTPKKALDFFNCTIDGFFDPYLLRGMKEAVDRIYLARLNNEKVVICGDYDADGICASIVLYRCLKEFGVNADIIIPERDDGYGINVNKVLSFHNENPVGLVITVDCGISEADKIDTLKNNGIDVLVTDHHEPPEVLPNCVCINPKISNQNYPFNGLCGAGVAYKVGYALISENANKYLDFVTLATVADSMDLISENRCIVKEGLKLFASNKIRSAFKYLIGDTNRQINAQTLAYTLAPRVNAGGRMGDANCALKLFLSEDENEIFDLSVKLNTYNVERQAECDAIYRLAKEKIALKGDYKNSVIMVYDTSWRVGFIGIVAARLVEDYNRPVIVFAGQDGNLKGSARSIDGVNIYNAISYADEFTVTFGGHSQAAGVTVTKENFENFYRKVDEYIKETVDPNECEETINVDWEMEGGVSVRFAEELERLEPFGTGNKKPLFTVKAGKVKPLPLKPNSPHYSMKINGVELLDFNGEKDVLPLILPVEKTVIFEINYSVYKGFASVKGYVKKIVSNCVSNEVAPYVLRNNLLTALKENVLDSVDVLSADLFEIGFGTLYVTNSFNGENLNGGFTPSCFNVKKVAKNTVIVSPNDIPECFERVIYTFVPLKFLKGSGKTFVIENAKKDDEILSLSVDRNDFALVFNTLKILENKEFYNSVDFFFSNNVGGDINMFIFATEVFLELGIFSVDNFKLCYNDEVKNPLTNSKIFRAVADYKGEKC